MSADDNQITTAGDLNAGFIGSNIRFMLTDEFLVITTVIEAELRQVYHTSADTTINVGYQAAKQYTLAHDTPVTIDPVPPLSYVHDKGTVRVK